MEKYRNSGASLNTTFPLTNNRFLNTSPGPLYTIGSSANLHQQRGPQLLMNATSLGTSTQFQFVPARQHSTTTSNFSASSFHQHFDMGNSIGPIFNSVKTFFANLLKSKVTETATMTDTTADKRKCNSAPNIYMDIMSDSKCSSGDFDKSAYVDCVGDYDTLAKLSSSTKSFSDFNLPVSAVKSNTNCSTSPTRTPDCTTNVVDASRSFEETEAPHTTKEITLESSSPLPSLDTVSPVLAKTKTGCSFTMPNVPTKPWRVGCPKGKRPVREKGSRKSKRKGGKNKKEKDRHELALEIYEDCETMSTDEWEEPLVIITATSTTKTHPTAEASPPQSITSKLVSFSTDDFPAMAAGNSSHKQTWELPRLSHCLATLSGKRQRQLSECDSDDSFIVFDNEDKFTPSSVESNQSICDRIRSKLSLGGGGRQRQLSESSDDDFICFEMEQSDAESDCHRDDDDEDDDDEADCDVETFSSDSDGEVDVKSSGTNPPDSGFEDKKVRFNLKPVVHVLRTWSFAYHQARKGEWEQNGRDRVRFHDRIKRLESTLAPILDSDHRQRIYCDRFLSSAADKDEPATVQ